MKTLTATPARCECEIPIPRPTRIFCDGRRLIECFSCGFLWWSGRATSEKVGNDD